MILWGEGKVFILAPKYGEDSYTYIVRYCVIFLKLYSVNGKYKNSSGFSHTNFSVK